MSFIFDLSDFNRVVGRAIRYGQGFMDGFRSGGAIVSAKIAAVVEEMLGKYIDAKARSSPGTLHHVYEWGSVGGARLFNITASPDAAGVTVSSSFTQSGSISDTATVPFYNKAEIMEAGTPITITPAEGSVLYFLDGGEEVFVSSSVTVTQPGGPGVQGSYKETFDSFFRLYFSQSVLRAVGFYTVLATPSTFSLAGDYGAGAADARRWLSMLGGPGA